MYNEQLKNEFVREYTSSESIGNACKAVFNATEKYEQEWSQDICTKDETILEPVLEEIVGFKNRSKYMRLSILKDYAEWCIKKRVPGACDGMLKVHIVGLKKMRQQTISCPAHLESYLNKVFDPADEKTLDNIYRCYYWFAFAGIKEEDIVSIKRDNVDFVQMIVRYGGMEYPIYREAIPAIKNCIELNQFLYKHPCYKAEQIWRDRYPGDTLIRGIRSNPSIKAMRVALSRHSKSKRDSGDVDLKLSYHRVWISGLFYRMYEQEQIGIEPDFKPIISQQLGLGVHKSDAGNNTQEDVKRQLVYEYCNDYQRWKLAHRR